MDQQQQNSTRKSLASQALIALIIVMGLATFIPFVYATDAPAQAQVLTASQAGALKYGVAPNWTPIARIPGQIDQPGDLYLVDAIAIPQSEIVVVTLLLTNPGDLRQSYSYLHLNMGIYREQAPGTWLPATGPDGQRIEEAYLSLLDGQVQFVLPGGSRYAITIEGGAYHVIHTDRPGGTLSPTFHASVS